MERNIRHPEPAGLQDSGIPCAIHDGDLVLIRIFLNFFKIFSVSHHFRTIEKMTDVSLLAEPVFLLYAISNLLTSIAFNSPLVFLPSHATSLGCTHSEAARIVSAFGEYFLFSVILKKNE